MQTPWKQWSLAALHLLAVCSRLCFTALGCHHQLFLLRITCIKIRNIIFFIGDDDDSDTNISHLNATTALFPSFFDYFTTAHTAFKPFREEKKSYSLVNIANLLSTNRF